MAVNEYFHRTPTSTGSRHSWTLSFWVKRNAVAANQNPENTVGAFFNFYTTQSVSPYESVANFNANGTIQLARNQGGVDHELNTSNVFRDVGNWMHILVKWDVTKGVAQERLKLYVNGVLQDSLSGSFPSQNYDGAVNTKVMHTIGTVIAGGVPYAPSGPSMEYFDWFLVDGQALTPDVFGFYKDGDGYISVGSTQATDFRPGQWSPHSPRKIKSDIERRGGFGVNGFYLPMNDSSNFGADFHCAPNSIIKLKGEDLPQPRNGAPTTSDSYVSQLRQETGSLGFDGVVKFDGSALNRLTLPVSSDFAFGTGDLTVEMFVYHTDLTGQQTYFGDTYAATAGLYLYKTSTNQISVYDTAQRAVSAANVIKKGQWHHLAWTVSSGVLRQFVDGNKITETSYNGNYTTTEYFLGDTAGTSSGEFIGFMSNVRVIKGTALYTADFTAPTEPLTNVTNTKLLCCNSSTSATAATVTPGTITKTSNVFATRNELTGSMVLAVPGISTARIPSDTELVTNGTFDSNANGWSVTSGSSSTLTYDSTSQNIDIVRNNEQCIETDSTITIESGKFYKLSWELVSTSDGNNGYVYLQMTGTTLNTPTTSDYRGTGKYESIFYASSTTSAKLRVQAGGISGLQFTLDNISIKEVSNLIANGHFDTNTTGWTAKNAVISVSNGQITVDDSANAGGNSAAIQNITTVIGQRYTATMDVISETQNAYMYLWHSGWSATGAGSLASISSVGAGHHTISFTATSTTTTLGLLTGGTGTAVFDNIVVKQEDAPRDYSADIKGSGTNKTLTPTGNAGVSYELGGYYGSALSSNTSGGFAFASSDFAFGTDDFTFECWFYLSSDTSSIRSIFDTRTSDNLNSGVFIGINSDDNLYTYAWPAGTGVNNIMVPAINQWHHLVLERNGSVGTVYLNGVAVDVTDMGSTDYTQSGGTLMRPSTVFGTSNAFTGYVQDARVYKGVAKYKGGFDVPKPYTPVGIESWRQVSDTCKNNFATWNPLLGPQGCALADGNLTVTSDGANTHKGTRSTIGMSSGKWYWEYRVGSVVVNSYVGVSDGMTPAGLTAPNYILHGTGGNNFVTSGAFTVTDASFTTGMIIGCAFDRDASSNQLKIYKNGTLAVTGTSTDLGDGVIYLAHNSFNAAVSDGWEGNFGQNPTFSGTVTAGTYTDSNGKGLFKHQPPAGYLALCEDNLPTPAIADPGDYFKTVLYRGTGSSRAVTGVGFKPDFIWCKSRTNTEGHIIFDSVRGPEQRLLAMGTQAEATSAGGVMSFDDDGYSTAQYAGTNQSGQNYVAWCWKAGGAAVSNTDGSITSQVSANQTAGFSIVSYTGTGSAEIVGHGLGKKPSFIMLKERYSPGNSYSNWQVYHSSLGATQRIQLNVTNAASTASNIWNNTEPTSDVFSIGSSGAMSENGGTYVAYCWSEIEGYSKFGSYEGSGNADGPFVYCGFKPAFVLVKSSTNSSNWLIMDNARNSKNPVDLDLYANLSNSETEYDRFDYVSNGFKVRNTSGEMNTDGATYIFMAFAESPFQTANAK